MKPHLQDDAEDRDRGRAQAVLLAVHDRVLRLAHPFMPFVTEELWQTLPAPADAAEDGRTPDGGARTVTRAPWPRPVPEWADDEAVSVLTLLQEVITAVRTVRAELGVPPSRRLRLRIEGAEPGERAVLDGHGDYLRRLAGLEAFEFVASAPADPDTVRRVVRRMRLYLPLAGVIDRAAETARLRRGDRQALEAARLAGGQARQSQVPGARRPGGGGRDRGPARGGAAAPAAARRGAGGAVAVTPAPRARAADRVAAMDAGRWGGRP